MKNKKAFSLIELQVSLTIAAIMVLIVGVIASLSQNSYNKSNKEAQLYNDISYGFKSMQNKVRSSPSMSAICPSGSWISNKVNVSSGSFGIFRDTSKTPATRDFSFDNGVKREVILSVPDADNSSLNLDLATPVNCDTGAALLTCGTSPVTYIAVRISGNKDNLPFSMCTTILRRS